MGGPISLGSLKKGHQILKGGPNGLMGGSSTLVSLERQILLKNELTCTLNR